MANHQPREQRPEDARRLRAEPAWGARPPRQWGLPGAQGCSLRDAGQAARAAAVSGAVRTRGILQSTAGKASGAA